MSVWPCGLNIHMRMREIITENDAPIEQKFYARGIEHPKGMTVWQYGVTSPRDADKIMWFSGVFKTVKGAQTAATRRYMNPNGSHQFTSEFFKNPIILDTVPLTNIANPFCMD
jgi:hypothetical protein